MIYPGAVFNVAGALRNMDIAHHHNLVVVEDAAQAVMSSYKGKALGSIGDMGCYSFHETKNVIAGEGGALLINNPKYIERAEIIREKGTNRSRFFRGQVDKYTWVDIGSSYLPGEIVAAFLWAQLEQAEVITENRLAIWSRYHSELGELARVNKVRRPIIPEGCNHNAHMFYLLLKDFSDRTAFINEMKEHGVSCVFHYIPLHSSPEGLIHARAQGNLLVTTKLADCLVRLPMWVGMNNDEITAILNSIASYFSKN